MAEELEFEVDDTERRHLTDLTRQPGYRVLKKILQSWLDVKRDQAVALSKIDPLANRDLIANTWASLATAEEMVEQLEAGVSFELSVLKVHERPKLTPAEIAERRRRFILGELDLVDDQGDDK